MCLSHAPDTMLVSLLREKIPGTNRRLHPCILMLFPCARTLKQYVHAYKQLDRKYRATPTFHELQPEDSPRLIPSTLDFMSCFENYARYVEEAKTNDAPTFIIVATVIRVFTEMSNHNLKANGDELFTYSCIGTMLTPNYWESASKPDPNEVSSTMQRCSVCAFTPSLKVCARCGVSRYCSRECQRKAWSSHKTLCVPTSEFNTKTTKFGTEHENKNVST